jgi:hypothetical protein
MLCGSGLCVGVGFGWVLIAWPLWLVDTLVVRHFSVSCAMFHTVGLIAGLSALREVRVPRGIAWVAIPTGLAFFLLARWLTDPSLNINAAFHVQPGWNWAFPGLPESLGVQAVAYTLVFWYLPSLSRRVAAPRNRP